MCFHEMKHEHLGDLLKGYNLCDKDHERDRAAPPTGKELRTHRALVTRQYELVMHGYACATSAAPAARRPFLGTRSTRREDQ
jgi:hypothetical protein